MGDHRDPGVALEAVATASAPAAGTVDVWLFDLDATATSGREHTLSPPERERARRLASPAARREFVATRVAVRQTLARYVRREPGRVPLEQRCPRCGGPHGKPVLAGDLSGALSLSVSHSHGRVAALAVAAGGVPVGVDVEVCAGRARDFVALSRRFFTPREALAVERAAAAERARIFLALWTRKEAFLKATGHGLTKALGSVEVSAERRSPGIVGVDGGTPGTWTVADIPNGVGAIGALVCPVGNRMMFRTR